MNAAHTRAAMMTAASRFWATIEIVSSTLAILEMTDGRGEWAGGGRVEIRRGGADALYEEGYRQACQRAAAKGGTLDRYSRWEAPRANVGNPAACGHHHQLPLERRRANALNIETATPQPRCTAKPPNHWPEGMVLRWFGSGGAAYVFGLCTPRCCPHA